MVNWLINLCVKGGCRAEQRGEDDLSLECLRSSESGASARPWGQMPPTGKGIGEKGP